MSAWLCGNKTLSLCVDVIKSEEFKKYDTDEVYSSMQSLELVELLSDLNTKSLNCRYGVNKKMNVLSNKQYIPLNVSDAQKHKSVRCYLYQTCESEECCQHPLFKLLKEWSEDVYEKYSPFHKECEWDMDTPLPINKIW